MRGFASKANRQNKGEKREDKRLSAELFFQILAERHECGSVIITTNLGFADWTQIFGDPNMTAALLDRLTHRAHIIECTWDSYRLKQALKTGDNNHPQPEKKK